MAAFRYKAMAANGAILRGVLDAPSEAAVVHQLRAQGHFPVSASAVERANLTDRITQVLQFSAKPSLTSLRTATEELAALLQAGLELDRALGILSNLSNIGRLREPFANVRARVRDGASFADAIDADETFPGFYSSMVRAGEFGGTLGPTLQRLADYLARTVAIRESVTSALIYPAILVASSAVSISVILLFVLPEFQPLFEQAGKALPLPARIVMGLGDFARATWWLFVIAGIAATYYGREVVKKPASRLRFDRWLLSVPLFGSLIIAAGTERFSRTLGTLLANGVPLPAALALTRDVIANRVMSDSIGDTAQRLREGDSLAERLAETKLFPGVTVDLVRIGEETGRLPEMLLRQADLDEHRLRHTIDRLIALLVPGLTIVMGVVIAGLIASMLMAILSINDLAVQ